MDLLDLMVTIGAKDEATDKISGIGGRIKGVLGGAAKVGAAAIGSIATGVSALTGAATKSYSTYEQLSGGMKALFGDAYGTVMSNANRAYETMGMSANSYMETVTGLSGALRHSIGDNFGEVARMADVAMGDIADNASVYGTDVSAITEGYMSLARGNYQMLDTVTQGYYAGTKTGLQQLISDANEFEKSQGRAGDLTTESYADIVQAIHDYQVQMGVSGNAAKEAYDTVSGSLDMTKAAWENMLTAIGSGQGVEQAAQNLVKSAGALAKNLVPVVTRSLTGIVQALPDVINSAATTLGPAVMELGRTVAEQFTSVFSGAVKGIGPALQSALGGLDSIILQSIGHAAAAGIDVTPILRYRDEAKAAFDNLKTTAQNVGKSFQDSFSHVDLSSLKSGLQSIIDLNERMTQGLANVDWSPLTDGLAAGLQHVSDIAGPAMTRLTEALSNPVVQQGVQALVDIVGTLANILGGVLGVVINVVLGLVEGAIVDASYLLIAIDAVKNGIVTGVSAVISFFGQLPGAIGGFLGSVIQSVVSWATGIVSHATSAGSQFVNAIGTFFGQLPGKVGGFLTSVIGRVVSWVSQMASHATSAGSRFLSGVGSAMTALPGRIGGFLSSALGKVAAFAGSLATRAVQAGQGFLRGIQGGFQQAVSFVGGIPGRIRGAIGNLGGLLLGAGRSVMDGLLNGLKSGFGAVKDFVGGIADWIKSHKGPIEYDRMLLIPNGMAIMESLAEGLSSGFDGGVAPYVRSVAGGISDALSAPFDVSAAGVVDVQSRGVSAAVQQGNAELERWLETRLGPIIERYAPTATPREFGRMVRSYA